MATVALGAGVAPVLAASSPPAVFPFPPGAAQRPPDAHDALPAFWADGQRCSVDCPAADAIPGWPMRPFHRQHALRAGLNERRKGTFHIGVDIQAPDLERVYAIQPGYARVLERTGSDARVLVGNFIYWHVYPRVHEGQYVVPYRTLVGLVRRGEGHLHLSELDPLTGRYLNPLRPGGRSLAPWRDAAAPAIAEPAFKADGRVFVRAFDPQSFGVLTTYWTPVLAPAALAYRIFDGHGLPVGPLQWALRGSQLVPGTPPGRVFAPDADARLGCFSTHRFCRPNWRYRLAGGLAPRVRLSQPGLYLLSVYAWDWAGNASARDRPFVVQ